MSAGTAGTSNSATPAPCTASGETAHTGHLVLDEHTSAASAYVGETRGRTANDLHLVAKDIDDARAQWIDAADRGRPDLGLDAARQAADHGAGRYAEPSATAASQRSAADPGRLAHVLDQLRAAWTDRANARAALTPSRPQPPRPNRAGPRRAARADDHHPDRRGRGRGTCGHRPEAAQQARRRPAGRTPPAWDTDREIASQNASMVQGGAGWFGGITRGNKAVADAERELGRWAEKWRPVVRELTDVGAAKRYAARHPGNDAIDAALHDYVRGRAERAMPIEVQRVQAAETAAQLASEAAEAYTEAIYQHQVR